MIYAHAHQSIQAAEWNEVLLVIPKSVYFIADDVVGQLPSYVELAEGMQILVCATELPDGSMRLEPYADVSILTCGENGSLRIHTTISDHPLAANLNSGFSNLQQFLSMATLSE